jgi:hypothetical protein
MKLQTSEVGPIRRSKHPFAPKVGTDLFVWYTIPMADKQQLVLLLHRLDGRGYPAYKDIRGQYAFDTFTLYIDHVPR